MKRAKQLQPLSREHHYGLHVSRHARECPEDAEQIRDHWQGLTDYINKDMTQHFQVEDDVLLTALAPYRESEPEVASALQKLEEQHLELEQLSQLKDGESPTAEQVRKLATALYDHVRFEERELFPTAEKYLSTDELDAIYAASADNVKRPEEGR